MEAGDDETDARGEELDGAVGKVTELARDEAEVGMKHEEEREEMGTMDDTERQSALLR